MASCDQKYRLGGCDESHTPPPMGPGTGGPSHLDLGVLQAVSFHLHRRTPPSRRARCRISSSREVFR